MKAHTTHIHHEGHDIVLDKDGRCTNCRRPVPKVKPDAPVGPKRSKVTITEPLGEEGTFDELLIQVVDRVKADWPDQLGPVGSEFWRYKALHWLMFAFLNAPPSVQRELLPNEEGG